MTLLSVNFFDTMRSTAKCSNLFTCRNPGHGSCVIFFVTDGWNCKFDSSEIWTKFSDVLFPMFLKLPLNHCPWNWIRIEPNGMSVNQDHPHSATSITARFMVFKVGSKSAEIHRNSNSNWNQVVLKKKLNHEPTTPVHRLGRRGLRRWTVYVFH